jgi:chromosome segregation ATPase
MAVKALPDLESTVASDDFRALEEKVFQAIAMIKSAREAQTSAEREVRRLREQMNGGHEEVESLRREAIVLRKEREEIRARVEKMLKQLDALATEDSAR